MYVYASLCDFVCIALLLPFVLGFCQFCFVFLSIVFSACYNGGFFFFGLVALFFLSFFYYSFIFNNFLNFLF